MRAKTVQVPKRIKEWWFVADNGKTCVSLRYGAKVISLGAKGVTAVELANSQGSRANAGDVEASCGDWRTGCTA